MGNRWKALKNYIKNRWIRRLHCLTSTSLDKGVYYDLDDRLLHCCFDAFKKFIEDEKGLDTLDWEMHLDHAEAQAGAAMEARALYDWWTTIRPTRGDPYEAGEEQGAALYALGLTIEARYDVEDDDMLARLVRIRGWLWT